MKVLVFGPSGSGKTFLANAFRKKGINAFDADQIPGLAAWYDRNKNKIAPPQTAREALENQYSYFWSRKFLSDFLASHENVFLFGGSGNIFNLFSLFDKVFYLKIDPELQKKRLQNATDRNSEFDFQGDELVTWGNWLEEKAVQNGIPFVDAGLSPEEIFGIISRPDPLPGNQSG